MLPQKLSMSKDASILHLPSWKRPRNLEVRAEFRSVPDVETFGFANLRPNTSKLGASSELRLFELLEVFDSLHIDLLGEQWNFDRMHTTRQRFFDIPIPGFVISGISKHEACHFGIEVCSVQPAFNKLPGFKTRFSIQNFAFYRNSFDIQRCYGVVGHAGEYSRPTYVRFGVALLQPNFLAKLLRIGIDNNTKYYYLLLILLLQEIDFVTMSDFAGYPTSPNPCIHAVSRETSAVTNYGHFAESRMYAGIAPSVQGIYPPAVLPSFGSVSKPDSMRFLT